jgi:transposase-like protein
MVNSLSTEAVRDILLSQDSQHAAARRHGVSRQSIQLIRAGKSHKDKFPEIPRRNTNNWHSCKECKHWLKGRMFIYFPEPAREHVFCF